MATRTSRSRSRGGGWAGSPSLWPRAARPAARQALQPRASARFRRADRPTPVPCSADISSTGSNPSSIELDDARPRALVVGLVDGQRSPAGPSAEARGRSSRRPDTSPSRPSTRNTSRSAPAMARCPCRTTSSCSGSSLAPYSPPVSNSSKIAPLPRHRARERVPRRAGHGRDDRPPRAGDAVEKRRFPDVRAADQDDGRRFSGSLRSKCHLASALTA